MSDQTMREFAVLTVQKRKAEAELKELNEKLRGLEPAVMNHMMSAQIKNQTLVVDGQAITLYVHEELWAFPKRNGEGERDKGTVTKVLKRCGLSDYVTTGYNTNSLSAYVRERLNNGAQLQSTLEAVLELERRHSVRGRRSSATSESKTAGAIRTLGGK